MRDEAGFTYVTVLFFVAFSAIIATRAMENGAVQERRSREQQLLDVGTEYRNAIRDYYINSPGTLKSYPESLEALLNDGRTSRLRRHLRKVYRDPLTGNAQWGLVRDDAGGVMGVYSLAPQAPLRRAGFAPEFASFVLAKTYQDWKFVYEANQ